MDNLNIKDKVYFIECRTENKRCNYTIPPTILIGTIKKMEENKDGDIEVYIKLEDSEVIKRTFIHYVFAMCEDLRDFLVNEINNKISYLNESKEIIIYNAAKFTNG